MKVITAYPVKVQQVGLKGAWGVYSSLDGNSPSTQIQFFQDWLDKYKPGWLDGKNLNKGKGYGSFGKWTKRAYKKHGSEFDKVVASIGNIGNTISGIPTVSATDPAGRTKAGHLWDKAKGMWVKAKETGLVDQLTSLGKDMLAQAGYGTGSGAGTGQMGAGYTDPAGGYVPGMDTGAGEPQKKLSTGAKIGIGVGIIALIALVIYATKGKGEAKAKAA